MRKLLICLGFLAAMGLVTWAQEVPDQGSSVGDEVIQQVLEPLRTGIQTHNLKLAVSAFDPKELSSYSDLEGNLRAFFRQFDEIRFRYQLLQVSADQDHASATAEMDIDALPYEATRMPVRRSTQMRLQLKREAKAWRIASFTPADFLQRGVQEQQLAMLAISN